MSYAGSVLDAINRNKANRALQINRRNAVKDKLSALPSTYKSNEGNRKFKPKVNTEIELIEIRAKIKTERRTSMLKSNILSIFLVVLLILISSYIFGLIKPFM